jgi:hypothetical protein
MMLPPDTKLEVDEHVGIRFPRNQLHLFDAGDGHKLS